MEASLSKEALMDQEQRSPKIDNSGTRDVSLCGFSILPNL